MSPKMMIRLFILLLGVYSISAQIESEATTNQSETTTVATTPTRASTSTSSTSTSTSTTTARTRRTRTPSTTSNTPETAMTTTSETTTSTKTTITTGTTIAAADFMDVTFRFNITGESNLTGLTQFFVAASEEFHIIDPSVANGSTVCLKFYDTPEKAIVMSDLPPKTSVSWAEGILDRIDAQRESQSDPGTCRPPREWAKKATVVFEVFEFNGSRNGREKANAYTVEKRRQENVPVFVVMNSFLGAPRNYYVVVAAAGQPPVVLSFGNLALLADQILTKLHSIFNACSYNDNWSECFYNEKRDCVQRYDASVSSNVAEEIAPFCRFRPLVWFQKCESSDNCAYACTKQLAKQPCLPECGSDRYKNLSTANDYDKYMYCPDQSEKCEPKPCEEKLTKLKQIGIALIVLGIVFFLTSLIGLVVMGYCCEGKAGSGTSVGRKTGKK